MEKPKKVGLERSPKDPRSRSINREKSRVAKVLLSTVERKYLVPVKFTCTQLSLKFTLV
jgi:hypothetical protein